MVIKSATKYLILLCLLGASYAHQSQSFTTVVGKPLAGQSNYTINSSKAIAVDVNCVFRNKSHIPAELTLWTKPDAKKPTRIIKLRAMKKKPITATLTFRFNLKPHWWCLIHVPQKQKENKYCQYFSVAEVTISIYRGFTTWNKTTDAKKTSYSCTLKPSNPRSYFFYFR